MNLHSMIALGAAVFVLAATPGPGVFATLSRALASGFVPAVVMAAGIVLGDLIFLLLSIYGLTAVADLLGNVFLCAKYAGGAYLIWLGLTIWRSEPKVGPEAGNLPLSGSASFLSGLMITLGNPKVILFYLGFLPTFLDLTALTGIDVMIAAMIVSGVLGTVLIGYAYTAARSRRLLTRTRTRKIMNRASGSVMMATGAVLIARN